MIHDLFPHAQIIADRFHVVSQVYRALNIIRIQTMKYYGSDSRTYRQLKRYWKLLLKDETQLNYTDFQKRRNYRYAYLTEQEIIDRLLTLSQNYGQLTIFIRMCFILFVIKTFHSYKPFSQQHRNLAITNYLSL
nr:transposase [Weissella confusa]